MCAPNHISCFLACSIYQARGEEDVASASVMAVLLQDWLLSVFAFQIDNLINYCLESTSHNMSLSDPFSCHVI